MQNFQDPSRPRQRSATISFPTWPKPALWPLPQPPAPPALAPFIGSYWKAFQRGPLQRNGQPHHRPARLRGQLQDRHHQRRSASDAGEHEALTLESYGEPIPGNSSRGGAKRRKTPKARRAAIACRTKASGGLKAWLPLIVAVVTMPVLAFATTRFVLLPKIDRHALAVPDQRLRSRQPRRLRPAPRSSGRRTKPLAGKTKVTVPLSKMLVNVAGTMGTRYLMTSVTLVGNNAGFQNQDRRQQGPADGPCHRRVEQQNHLRPGKTRRAQRNSRRTHDGVQQCPRRLRWCRTFTSPKWPFNKPLLSMNPGDEIPNPARADSSSGSGAPAGHVSAEQKAGAAPSAPNRRRPPR